MTTWGRFIFASFGSTKPAPSESFHFMRNTNSPLLSVAPIIRSGSRPLAKPLGLSAASLFFFDLLSSDSESAMIMKLFRGHCLRPHTCSHLGDASHAAPERTHHPISHGSTTCPYPLWAVILCSPCLNLRASWGPLNAPNSRSQSRTQRTIQACTATANS